MYWCRKQKIKYHCQLNNQYGRHAENEAFMLGFMTEGIHPGDTADASAHQGGEKKIGLRDTERASFCLPFVDTHHGKTHYIHYYNIKKKN